MNIEDEVLLEIKKSGKQAHRMLESGITSYGPQLEVGKWGLEEVWGPGTLMAGFTFPDQKYVWVYAGWENEGKDLSEYDNYYIEIQNDDDIVYSTEGDGVPTQADIINACKESGIFTEDALATVPTYPAEFFEIQKKWNMLVDKAVNPADAFKTFEPDVLSKIRYYRYE